MAEEVNYATVKFKNKRPKPEAENKEEIVYEEVKINSETTEEHPDINAKKEDEIVYGNVKIHSETTEKHPDTNAGLLADKEPEKGRDYKKLAYCFGTFCFILLLGIIGLLGGVFIHTQLEDLEKSTDVSSIDDVASLLKANQTALQEENYNLTSRINNLTSEKENLSRSLRNVTDQLNEFINLTTSRSVLKEEITNLTAESEDLTNKKKNLETQNQDLKAKKTNLKGQIQNYKAERENITGQIKAMEAETIKLNTSRAQWSINAYCRQTESPTACKPCEKGWLDSQSSCYAVNDPQPAGRRNWEEAQEICRGKGSDLVVVADVNEKKTISDYSWSSSGLHGYWIGLRAEHGKWKWVDGSGLAETFTITGPLADGRCVISVQNEGWKSVGCDEKQRWICGKSALSV